jgi:hypothetical protein
MIVRISAGVIAPSKAARSLATFFANGLPLAARLPLTNLPNSSLPLKSVVDGSEFFFVLLIIQSIKCPPAVRPCQQTGTFEENANKRTRAGGKGKDAGPGLSEKSGKPLLFNLRDDRFAVAVEAYAGFGLIAETI